MLTKKQKDLLLFIHERMGQGDIAPSFDEMREALQLKSKSGIHRLITGLVERGYLERLPHRARALEVKKLPEGYNPGRNDNTKSAAQTREINAVIAHAANIRSIPMQGRIAAGTPIEAIRDDNTTIDVPASMAGAGKHYALEIDGDSMVNIGIQDGDTVIIKECTNAEDGAIVVALVDGEEVTLKRLKREKGKILLIPENDAYETRSFEPNRVAIQGRLVSLMRTYH
ncbi:MAG: repressor LexA [Micavibrio aeruginosavorus]|uniref:LexA repressor n=1 Tax=Micavibrio aeruginosavorus TaxID=349221 RepID=A0A2W5MW70_9BACT|nr:MAG: repressor LexA [Micavibrio aeruginosavorus]